MSHNCTVLSQILKLLPRHEFEKLANRYDGRRRSDALSVLGEVCSLKLTGTIRG